MRGELHWFAYWIQENFRKPGEFLNCIRGPKDTYEEMVDEVQRMYHGHVEYIQLHGSLETNKPILRDKLALLHQDAARAMQRFSIRSVPGAKNIPHQMQYQQT
jgi:hypothetical protein